LSSATNPESGAISYTYDNNGNLHTKTDARSIITTYTYDALDRNETVNYSDTAITPDITRVYDTATNGKGRLRESYSGGNDTTGVTVEHTKIISYDAIGRPLDQRQRFKSNSVWSSEYRTQRSYNLAGHVLGQTYPSVHSVSYKYNQAGRLADQDAQNPAFKGTLGDGIERVYAQGITYSSFGSLAQERFGTDTPIYNKLFYNVRGQLAEIREGLTPNDTNWERGAIINHYSEQCWGMCGGPNSTTAMTDNNGNLKYQDMYIPQTEQMNPYKTWRDDFDYDSLNRLKRVHEYTYQGMDWQQEYLYDRWGNRQIDFNNTSANVPRTQFDVNPTTDNKNRIYAPNDPSRNLMSYDAAGNLINDGYSSYGNTNGQQSRFYDAENRMVQAKNSSGGSSYYTYNADGQRTRRKTGSIETWQIYGLDGELLAEYAASAVPGAPQKEYGYRNGQLLITAEAPVGGGVQNVNWTSVSPTLQVTGNSLQKTSGTSSWYDAGAVSAQTINAGDGYVEFTPGNTTTWRMIGLGNGNTAIYFSDIEFAFFVGPSAGLQIYESGVLRGSFGTYAASDRLRVAVEAGVVKYRKNGVLVYTSTVTPTYPLLVDTSFNTVWSPIYDVVISFGSVSNVNWLVADQLGTPRMVFDKTGWLANVKRHDYLPFGEELIATQGLRTQSLGYTADTVRQKFTLKERDIETGLDYFLARYYSSSQGRFTSVDPLMASGNAGSPQSWNRYSYCFNNPLRFTDPTGMLAGDFYDEEGKRLGTDGRNDGKVYVVTNESEAKQVRATDKKGGTTQLSAVGSAVELPSFDVRQAIGAAVERSNSPTSDDKKGGFHEEGITYGTNASGAEQIIVASPGAASNPQTDSHASIALSNFANKADQGALVSVGGTAHVHPKGEITVTTGPAARPGVTVIGGTVTTTTFNFVQAPSARDIQNAIPGQTNVVAGARDKKAYIYDNTGVRATMPLKHFLGIGKR
jgi:RHS repeat-associated protein